MTSALYAGTVVHQRFRPTRHRLRYRMDWVLLDLDAMPRLRLFGRNRFNLVSFCDADHLGGTRPDPVERGEAVPAAANPPGSSPADPNRRGATRRDGTVTDSHDGTGADVSASPLRAQVEAAMAAAGLAPDGGPIRLLCMPRVLGHAFNPLSVFFCHRRDGSLAAMLYEVNNTFGQRHSYLIPVESPAGRTIRQQCAKAFYVSPFMGMDITYDFRIVPPGDTAVVVVNGDDAEGRVITAAFAGRRRALTDKALLGLVARHGLLSLKVLGAIHWEALKLWLKGLRLQPRPAPPSHPVTIVTSPHS